MSKLEDKLEADDPVLVELRAAVEPDRGPKEPSQDTSVARAEAAHREVVEARKRLTMVEADHHR
eukprot:6414306-Alexandrium_andersonii.AAC.1